MPILRELTEYELQDVTGGTLLGVVSTLTNTVGSATTTVTEGVSLAVSNTDAVLTAGASSSLKSIGGIVTGIGDNIAIDLPNS